MRQLQVDENKDKDKDEDKDRKKIKIEIKIEMKIKMKNILWLVMKIKLGWYSYLKVDAYKKRWKGIYIQVIL